MDISSLTKKESLLCKKEISSKVPAAFTILFPHSVIVYIYIYIYIYIHIYIHIYIYIYLYMYVLLNRMCLNRIWMQLNLFYGTLNRNHMQFNFL